jgi:pectate lyase
MILVVMGTAHQAMAETPPTRVEAVRTFADTLIEHGRDTYRDEPTPLFVDRLNMETLEAVRAKDDQGNEVLPSNLARHQNLFRTLVGLTNLTGDAKYRQAAEDATRYHFEHLQMDCGLLQWGGHRWMDLLTGEHTGDKGRAHELKFHLPFYELMWEVDPDATERYIKALWNAHIVNWGTLDMNRHGSYGRAIGDLWANEFGDPEPFFEGRGLTFINAGSDLIYAGAMLHRLNGEEGALLWAKRLAEMYVKARHPETGLGVYQYSKPQRREEPPAEGPLEGTLTYSSYGDRAENQFGAVFGEVAREGWLLRSPNSIYGQNAIVQLQLAEHLGDEGAELIGWSIDGLRAWAQHAYDPETNMWRPIWADGTDLTGYAIPRTGYFGPEGRVFEQGETSPMLLWSYALGYRLSGDQALWETARAIARGHGLGDIGSAPGQDVDVDLETDNAHPHALFGMLEIIRATDDPAYRDLAVRIGDNIIASRFHPNLRVNVSSIEPLALLALEAVLQDRPEDVPGYRGGH